MNQEEKDRHFVRDSILESIHEVSMYDEVDEEYDKGYYDGLCDAYLFLHRAGVIGYAPDKEDIRNIQKHAEKIRNDGGIIN